MTREKIYARLCLMLAFQAAVPRDAKKEPDDLDEKVLERVRKMEALCDSLVSKAYPLSDFSFVDEPGMDQVDGMIDRHIEELRMREATFLPKDRQALIQMFDRLQQRRSRRLQWRFYASAKEEKLSDMVLRSLYEEIEDEEMEVGAA